MGDFIREFKLLDMKKGFILFFMAMLACEMLSAQQVDFRKVAERFKHTKTLVMDVTQTKHNAALTDDVIAKGHFYYQAPNRYSMIFTDAHEMFLAVDNAFIMVRDGKKRVAKAKGQGNNPFEVLSDVFSKLLSGSGQVGLSGVADVKLSQHGELCTITVTPIVADAKAKRRMMFTSCVAVINLNSAELRSLRIVERGKNYTQYDFSGYSFNAEINAGAFDVKSVMQ